MFKFDLFLDTSYLNVIVCCIVLLPNSLSVVFSLCAVNKRSIGNNNMIPIVVNKFHVHKRSAVS
jgi:hypothetical protein